MSRDQMKTITDTFLEMMKEMQRRHDEHIKELMNINTHQIEMLHDLADEVKTLRCELTQQQPKRKKYSKKSKEAEEKPKCCAMTLVGTRCKNSAFPGTDTCKKHVNYTARPVASTSKTKPPAVKKPPLKSKKKKIPPTHNHAVGEEPPGGFCQLCETHGDIFDPETPDLEFEDVAVGDKYLEERLRVMLESDDQ